MEGLRRAVHQEGPTVGHITLTIARKVRQGFIKDREGEGQSDDANGTIRIGTGGDNSSSYDHSGGSSDQSGSTVIFVSGGSECRERNSKEQLSGLSDLRNESYYRVNNSPIHPWSFSVLFARGKRKIHVSASNEIIVNWLIVKLSVSVENEPRNSGTETFDSMAGYARDVEHNSTAGNALQINRQQ